MPPLIARRIARVIEDVEEVSAHAKVHALTEHHVLVQRSIEVPLPELGNAWFRQGCRLLLNPMRWTVLLFSGIQTLLVSQLAETTVLAGALAGKAVLPHGINGVTAGL